MRNKLQLLMLGILAGCLGGCGGGATPSPGGNGSGNPLPIVTSISPSNAIVGGASFTLTVTGTNFVSGSVVAWGGTPLTTSFVGNTSVMASVPATNLSSAGTTQVTVANPAPGGGTSAAKTFTVKNPSPKLTALSQTSADAGSSDVNLTVSGSNFVQTSVVKWNGSARPTSFGSSTDLTVTIPASDLAFSGNAQVSVSNPTPGGGDSSGLTFTIAPQISHGIGLPGAPTDLAINATTELRESDVESAIIQGNLVMNRLDVRFARNATVDQVNTALAEIGAGIVHMSQGFTSVTIAVPPQSSRAGLETLVSHLQASPGVHRAKVATISAPDAIFSNDTFSFSEMAQQIRHLLPGRFPAAWNLAPTDTFGDPSVPTIEPCPTFDTPVLVDDTFSTPLDSSFTQFFAPLAEPDPLPANTPSGGFTGHGYFVTEIIGANGFGADPFPATSSCTSFHLVQAQAGGPTPNEETDYLVDHMPTGRFIVNLSRNDGNNCADKVQCVPPHDGLRGPLDRADDTLYWKEKTRGRWNDFLVIASAGNTRDLQSGAIYPGLTDSRFNSRATLSQVPDSLVGFLNDDSLWTPSAPFLADGFTSFKPTVEDQAVLAQDVIDAGMSGPDAIATNVIVVGSVEAQSAESVETAHVPPELLTESSFSNSGPDVFAVGEHIFPGVDLPGTSFSAPQVAGLVSYLWMISRDLRGTQPISVTKRAIVANTRNKVIDAYATVLSLDDAVLPNPVNSPVRLRLLDLNQDDKFDDKDIEEFLHQYFQSDSQGNVTDIPVQAVIDFSRYDLNGDGFTGGPTTERFDLDREGSTHYGTTDYSTVFQNIGGNVAFDETRLTDLQILCYYAYSGLYTGNDTARDVLLAGRCTPVTVTVDPGQVSLAGGSTQQFSATVHGTSDPRVTWTTTGGGNTIDNTGLFHAGSTGGTFTVRAVSVPDPNAFGEATVTVTSQNGCGSTLQGSTKNLAVQVFDHAGGDAQETSTDSSISNSFNTADSSETGTASFFTGTVSISDSNTGRDIPGGSAIFAQINDGLVIIPSDPALLGQPMRVTGTVTVTVSAGVSGARANAGWFVQFDMGGGSVVSSNALTSTLSALDRGNISGGTFSTTNTNGVFGIPIFPSAEIEVLTGYACDASKESCPPTSPAGTGTAQANATLHWGNLTVKDQAGNSVAFTQCSVSGFTY